MFRLRVLAPIVVMALTIAASWSCGNGDSSDDAEQARSLSSVAPTPDPTPESTPVPTPVPPPTLIGAGDIASCTQDNDVLTAALIDAVISGTDGEVVVFTAGDNVYEDGTIEEFEQCYHPAWGRHRDRTRPAPGNHEYGTGNSDGYFAYFGAAAGDPALGYYSYDLGDWHIIVLNTSDHCEMISCDAGSAQERWLRADLAAHPAVCTAAIWHDPLFSSGGTHGNAGYVQPFWQALYEYGADIVINGHEHNYERFAPQTAAGGADPNFGIREFIVGTGGESHYRAGESLIANSEAADDDTYGVLKLTLLSGGYEWEFIPEEGGSFRDSGSGVCHGPPPNP
jgi:hypothetical protein